MIAYTDSVEYAKKILADEFEWSAVVPEFHNPGLSALSSRIYPSSELAYTASVPGEFWRYLFAVGRASASQFDVVVDLCRRGIELPDGLLCSAGSGDLLHGQRDRPWVALPGNIHLTAHFAPDESAAGIGVGFSLLAAVSMIEAIDGIDGLKGRAGIKWVNDIVIDGAKVAGFITHTTSVDGIINAAVVGIGLNVEATPPITPDRFFHRAACLRDFLVRKMECNQRIVFSLLLERLADNYERLRAGRLSHLVDDYRDRSIVVGREVEILPDSPQRPDESPVGGIVTAIGDNLELYLEGRSEPVRRGRLAFIPEAP
jgi:biotin-(acetyl-CoA carboxylase) ligase